MGKINEIEGHSVTLRKEGEHMRIRLISDIDGNIEKSFVCETNEVKLEDRGYTVLVKDGVGQLIEEVRVDGQHYLEID